MNIYEKVNKIKKGILEANLKKSGYNKYSNFSYYELADITPTIVKLCEENKVMTYISYMRDYAKLEIIDIEKPEDRITYFSPMEELELKGCNKIQALGGTETYERRYLYMTAFDIIESDMFDATSGKTDEERAKEYKFGEKTKHPGKTILEVYKEDPKYLQWCLDNGKSEEVKGYIEAITNLKRIPVPESEAEQRKRLELINKIKEQHAFVDMEDLLEAHHVKDLSQIPTEELEMMINE